jgi:hypothetical protein
MIYAVFYEFLKGLHLTVAVKILCAVSKLLKIGRGVNS